MIRAVTAADAQAIVDIYNYYVENTTVSFEETPVTREEMEERIRRVTAQYPWLALEAGGEIEGYAYLSPWKTRSAYRCTAEVSIYLKKGLEGRGRGSALMERLLEEREKMEKMKIHVLTACITLPNPRSVGLHEKFGFQPAGRYREVGFKQGRWLDVGDWIKVGGR